MNIYQGGEKKVNLNILLAKRKFLLRILYGEREKTRVKFELSYKQVKQRREVGLLLGDFGLKSIIPCASVFFRSSKCYHWGRSIKFYEFDIKLTLGLFEWGHISWDNIRLVLLFHISGLPICEFSVSHTYEQIITRHPKKFMLDRFMHLKFHL